MFDSVKGKTSWREREEKLVGSYSQIWNPFNGIFPQFWISRIPKFQSQTIDLGTSLLSIEA